MLVVVRHVDAEHPLARTGVRMILVPSDRKTLSKPAVNFVSRSRIRKRIGEARSVSTSITFRACWVTHSPVGRAVIPATCTILVPSSMKTRTWSLRENTVSTVRKSHATMPATLRKARQLTQAGREKVRPRSPEDLPHGARSDPHTETYQPSRRPSVSPGGVLLRQADDQARGCTLQGFRRMSFGSTQIRVAELRKLAHARFSRCLVILPDEASTGETPQSLAKAASERRRSALSPAASSSAHAVSEPVPKIPRSAGHAFRARSRFALRRVHPESEQSRREGVPGSPESGGQVTQGVHALPEAPPVQRGLPTSRRRRGYRDGGLTQIEGHPPPVTRL